MSIKKYIASKDATITNAYRPDLSSRGINANIGASDSLEIFSIYGQTTSTSLEKSRILVDFPILNIKQDRQNSIIPQEGDVEFYLKLFNVAHPFSTPREFSVSISPLSSSWEEGYGLDMEGYYDIGAPTGSGVTWISPKSGSLWQEEGGDLLTTSNYDYYFQTGIEDLNVNITSIVENWLLDDQKSYGFCIKLSGSFEDGSKKTSFYTKKFSSRSSEYFFSRPCIEAQWSPIQKDDRGKFFASSSANSFEDNIMNLYFYNKVKGNLKNIVNNTIPDIKIYSDPGFTNELSLDYKLVTNPSVGVYRAQVCLNTTSSTVYDKWTNPVNNNIVYFNSYFDIQETESSDSLYNEDLVINIINLKNEYSNQEKVTFNIFCREKNWVPTIYSLTNTSIQNKIIDNLYYKIFRINDNYTIIDYSTGSIQYSKTSYNKEGNYFDLDMNILEKDYTYGIKFATYNISNLKELPQIFKFRIK